MFNKEYIIDGKVFNTKNGKKVFKYYNIYTMKTGGITTTVYYTKDKRWIGICNNNKHKILSEQKIKGILLELGYVKIYRKYFGELEGI